MSTCQDNSRIATAEAAKQQQTRFRPWRARWLLPTGLVTAYALLAATSVLKKSNTFDELVYLTSGYSYWIEGDYRLNSEAGNFPQRWATLPLLLREDVRFPPASSADWQRADLWKVGSAFFYRQGNDAAGMLLAGRMMILILGLLLGLLVYWWAATLGGRSAGCCALALFAFSPTMLAHSRLVTSDLAAALAFTASTFFFWRMLHRLTFVRILASSTAMGLLFLSKMSAVLMVPTCLLLVLMRIGAGRPLEVPDGPPIRDRRLQAFLFLGAGAAHGLMVLLMIWAAFGFRYSAFADATPHREAIRNGLGIQMLSHDLPLGGAVRFAADSQLLPQAYVFGFAYILKHSELRSAFLNGQHSLYGWQEFFPFAFAVKTPLPILIALVLSAAVHLRPILPCVRPSDPAARRREIYSLLPLVTFLAVYGISALTSHLNIGHRHLLPMYPALFILAGGGLAKLRQVSRTGRGLALAIPLVLAVESLCVWPHYLAYFNPLVGGPQHGYRHLVDSSLDWGQDLPALKDWLDRHRETHSPPDPVYLSYFGTADPDYYGIDARRLPGFMDFHSNDDCSPWSGGVYCLSATILQSVYSPARGPWTERYEADYQNLLKDAQRTNRTSSEWGNSDRKAPDDAPFCERLNALRLARMCAYLRQRKPDDQVGYTILIYRLSDQDVSRALEGAAPLEDLDRIRE